VKVDRALSEVSAAGYDAIVLPGGQMNPDTLRASKPALDLIRSFFDAGKVVAAVCHAPWLLIDTGIAKGRRLTSWPTVRTDLRNAGAEVVDEPVVADNGVVTSRKPDDLEAFSEKIAEEIVEGRHVRGKAA
jgi:protease I